MTIFVLIEFTGDVLGLIVRGVFTSSEAADKAADGLATALRPRHRFGVEAHQLRGGP